MGLNSGSGASMGAVTPQAIVKVNGQVLASNFNERLMSVSVEDKNGVTSDSVRLELKDGNPFVEIPKKGDILEIWLGYEETGVAYFGKYTVDDPEVSMFPFKISISGKGADMRDGLKSQKSRHWDNKTLKDVITDIAKDNNLEPKIDEELGAHEYEWLGQQDESDVHFAERLAKRHGALFSVKDGKLIFSKKGSTKTTTGKDITPVVARPENIVNGTARVKFSYRSKFKKVKAHVQDKGTATREEVESDSDSEGTADYEIQEPFADKDEAEAAAKAKANELKTQTVSASVTLLGDPTVRAGAPFSFENCRPEIDGMIFTIESANHELSKTGGYTVAIEASINADEDEKTKKGKKGKKKKGKGSTATHDLDWSDVEGK